VDVQQHFNNSHVDKIVLQIVPNMLYSIKQNVSKPVNNDLHQHALPRLIQALQQGGLYDRAQLKYRTLHRSYSPRILTCGCLVNTGTAFRLVLSACLPSQSWTSSGLCVGIIMYAWALFLCEDSSRHTSCKTCFPIRWEIAPKIQQSEFGPVKKDLKKIKGSKIIKIEILPRIQKYFKD